MGLVELGGGRCLSGFLLLHNKPPQLCRIKPHVYYANGFRGQEFGQSKWEGFVPAPGCLRPQLGRLSGWGLESFGGSSTHMSGSWPWMAEGWA